jgi:hypothetical protein
MAGWRWGHPVNSGKAVPLPAHDESLSKRKFVLWAVIVTPPLAGLFGLGLTVLVAHLENYGLFLFDSYVGPLIVLALTVIVALFITAVAGKLCGLAVRSLTPVLAYVAVITAVFVIAGSLLYVGVLCGPCQD